MTTRYIRILTIALVAGAAGCASAPSRFYVLRSTATSADAPRSSLGVLVGPVNVPGSVDRPEFVVQVAPNRVEIDEFNRWAAPLDESIARAVAGDLSVLLGTPDVAVAPMANFKAAYRVTLDVQRFDSLPGSATILETVWSVHQVASGEIRSGRTLARETVAEPGYEALAAAHSRALGQMSAEIAAAIQSMATTPR